MPVQQRFEEHLESSRLLAGAREVVVALSGGGDSTALLCLLASVAKRHGISLHPVHVEHRIRGKEAEEDGLEAARRAAALGLPFLLRRADVPAGRLKGESLEAAARRLRYGALRTAASELGEGTLIATGHTLDDQAETVLLNLARHSGRWRGGIRERRPDGVIRPLLPFRREELRAYLRERGVPWREDETNQDQRLLRNRIRLSTLPALETAWPGTAARLARAGEAWSERISRLDSRIDEALSASSAPLSGPWPRALFRSVGSDGTARLLIRAAGAIGSVPGRVQLRSASSRLLSDRPRFAEGLGGLRLVAEERGVRLARPAKLIP